MNLFPASAAILLQERTWMSENAIKNWLRNYGCGGHSEGQPLWVNVHTPQTSRYRLQYVDGLWRFVKEQ